MALSRTKQHRKYKKGLDFIINNYQSLQDNLEDKSFLDDFNWDNIGKVYEKLYLGEYDE